MHPSLKVAVQSAFFMFAIPLLHAAPAGPDPWARVPVLTTGCYQSSDDFETRLAAAQEAIARDLKRQEEINSALSEELKTIDPMELATRQQKYMMENPQEAMALMQRNQTLGENAAAIGEQNAARRLALAEERKAIDARYKAAVDAAMKPFEAKWKDLEARANKDKSVHTEAGTYTGWALQESQELVRQENAAFEKVCPQYWSATGAYPGWLKRFREQVTAEIPQLEEADSVGAGFIVMLISTPGKSWQSTAKFRAVRDYLDATWKVFRERPLKARTLM